MRNGTFYFPVRFYFEIPKKLKLGIDFFVFNKEMEEYCRQLDPDSFGWNLKGKR